MRCGYPKPRALSPLSSAPDVVHTRDARRTQDGEAEVSHFHHGVTTAVGARWSPDGKTAWKLVAGKPVRKVPVEDAKAIASKVSVWAKVAIAFVLSAPARPRPASVPPFVALCILNYVLLRLAARRVHLSPLGDTLHWLHGAGGRERTDRPWRIHDICRRL